MTRVGSSLIVIALGLLLISLIPWPSGASETAMAQPAGANKISLVDQGRALFLAKGCVTCHVHDALGELAGDSPVGPNLSDYQPDPGFVSHWLRDPAAIRPETQMPNLNLADDEIAALIAFLETASAKEGPADVALAPKSCPVTQSADPPFTPPDPDPSQGADLPRVSTSSLGSFEEYFWHGSESLWTQLRRDGVWRGLPQDERGYTQKLFFSRQGYDWRAEPQPALTVTGRRLDVAGPTISFSDATNGFHPDVGSFMLVGVDIPTAGCWEITGQYAGHELSYVVWIEPD